MNEKGKIYNTENLGFYRVEYSMRKDKIAVVIINRDNAKILKRCLKNVLNTKYQNIQIYVLDISSYDAEIKKVCDNLQKYKVQYWKCNREMFHNELCRTILHITQETYIMTILSYVFIDKKNCIEILMGNCQRRDVAAVGGKIIKKIEQSIMQGLIFIMMEKFKIYLKICPKHVSDICIEIIYNKTLIIYPLI